VCLQNQHYVEDWKVGVEGGKDFWVRTEQFAAKRKRGEIEPGLEYKCVLSGYC
jgi:hypothetical protein